MGMHIYVVAEKQFDWEEDDEGNNYLSYNGGNESRCAYRSQEAAITEARILAQACFSERELFSYSTEIEIESEDLEAIKEVSGLDEEITLDDEEELRDNWEELSTAAQILAWEKAGYSWDHFYKIEEISVRDCMVRAQVGAV